MSNRGRRLFGQKVAKVYACIFCIVLPLLGPGVLPRQAAVEGRVVAVEAPGLLRGARRGAHVRDE